MIPFALPRTFGKMVGDNRQGYLLVIVMAVLWLAAVGGISYFEWQHAGTRTARGGRRDGGQGNQVRHTGLVACSPGRRPSPRPAR